MKMTSLTSVPAGCSLRPNDTSHMPSSLCLCLLLHHVLQLSPEMITDTQNKRTKNTATWNLIRHHTLSVGVVHCLERRSWSLIGVDWRVESCSQCRVTVSGSGALWQTSTTWRQMFGVNCLSHCVTHIWTLSGLVMAIGAIQIHCTFICTCTHRLNGHGARRPLNQLSRNFQEVKFLFPPVKSLPFYPKSATL